MRRPAPIILTGILFLFLSGCEDGNSDYFMYGDLPLQWQSSLYAEWQSETLLQLHASIYQGYYSRQRSGLDAEFTLLTKTSPNGNWEELRHIKENGGYDWWVTFDIEVPPNDNRLHWYRLETRIYLRKRLETAYIGPVIVTSRPLLAPSTATALPELDASTPFRDYYSVSYSAPAISPDGRYLFVGDSYSRMFDLNTGRQLRTINQMHSTKQTASAWEGDVILEYGAGLHVLPVESLTTTDDVQGQYCFKRSDSEFVLIDRNSWLTYNPINQKFGSIRAEFQIPSDADYAPNSISQRPGQNMYVASMPRRDLNTWWLFDGNFNPIDSLSPIDESGLNFIGTSYYSSYSYDFSDKPVIWLDNNRCLLSAVWSGSEEWWVCNISTKTFQQVTGFDPAVLLGKEPEIRGYYGIYEFHPVVDKTNSRILYFVPNTLDRCGVFGINY